MLSLNSLYSFMISSFPFQSDCQFFFVIFSSSEAYTRSARKNTTVKCIKKGFQWIGLFIIEWVWVRALVSIAVRFVLNKIRRWYRMPRMEYIFSMIFFCFQQKNLWWKTGGKNISINLNFEISVCFDDFWYRCWPLF